MAEPALTALCRPTGEVEWYRSQWGGGRRRLAAVVDSSGADPYEPLLDCQWRKCETSVPESLDYLRLDAVYLVTSAGVWVFVPVWFGVPPAFELSPRIGALVGVSSIDECDRLRAGVRREKARLDERVWAGDCSPADAVRSLWERLGGRELLASGCLRRLLADPRT